MKTRSVDIVKPKRTRNLYDHRPAAVSGESPDAYSFGKSQDPIAARPAGNLTLTGEFLE